MKTPGSGREDLRELLRRIYKGKEYAQIDQRWKRGLMTRIREIGPPERGPLFLPSFERLVWRLAPVMALLAIALAALLVNLDANSASDALQMLTRGVEELTLAQLLAV